MTYNVDSIGEHIKHLDVTLPRMNCYQFYLKVKKKFPDAIPLHFKREGHIVIKIGDTYWDRRGLYLYPERVDPNEFAGMVNWNNAYGVSFPGPLNENVDLSDWFAGVALKEMLKSNFTNREKAEASYAMADAMMEVRNERK